MNATATASDTLSQLPACPSWCSGDRDDAMHAHGWHHRHLTEVAASNGRIVANVWITSSRDDQPAIEVNCTDDGLTPEQAASVHRGLGEALAAVS